MLVSLVDKLGRVWLTLVVELSIVDGVDNPSEAFVDSIELYLRLVPNIEMDQGFVELVSLSFRFLLESAHC